MNAKDAAPRVDEAISIGALAARSGVKVATIRFYEELKLMPAPPRTEGRQRRYTATHLDRLRFIRHSRDLGFSIEDVRELLRLAAHPDARCHTADAIAARQLAEVEAKIERLQALKGELKRMLAACEHGVVEGCRIVETLADHGRCAGER